MSYFPDHRSVKLRPALVLIELAALVIVLSVIHLTNRTEYLWLVGIAVVLLHTMLFYRLGRLSERARAQSSSEFLRGLKQGLMRRPDAD
jgi:high-affinity K+ transport system ATPase subunit B